jgi:hypothetical protein
MEHDIHLMESHQLYNVTYKFIMLPNKQYYSYFSCFVMQVVR